MGRSVSFSTLREAVRTRYDLPTFGSSTYVTTAHVNAMINASMQAYSAMLCEAYGDNYFTTSASATTSAGVGTNSLPTRFYKLTRLWWLRGTDDVVPILRANVNELGMANYSARSWTECGPRYRLQGTSLVQWLPKPNAVYDVVFDYVQLPADLSADGDTFEGGPGWDEWVVNDVCAKIAQREEKDPAGYLAVRADWEARIRAQATERDEAEALTVRDEDEPRESDYERRNRLTYGGR